MAERPSGYEMVLRSMGFGRAIDAIKTMIAQGTVEKVKTLAEKLAADGSYEKISGFINDLPEINARLARIERRILEPTGNTISGLNGSGLGASEPSAEHRAD